MPDLARASGTRATTPAGPPLGFALLGPIVSEHRADTSPGYELDDTPYGKGWHPARLCRPSILEVPGRFGPTGGFLGPDKIDKCSVYRP